MAKKGILGQRSLQDAFNSAFGDFKVETFEHRLVYQVPFDVDYAVVDIDVWFPYDGTGHIGVNICRPSKDVLQPTLGLVNDDVGVGKTDYFTTVTGRKGLVLGRGEAIYIIGAGNGQAGVTGIEYE